METCDGCGRPMAWCGVHSVFHHTGDFEAECSDMDLPAHDYFG